MTAAEMFGAAYALRFLALCHLDAGHSAIGAELLKLARRVHVAGLRLLADRLRLPATVAPESCRVATLDLA
jgi:hypothetical protein